MSWVISGIRRGANQVFTSRSTQMNVIASPMPTKSRATSASRVGLGEREADLRQRQQRLRRSASTAVARSGRRAGPTGICMPAYTSSWSIAKVASCEALMSKRSVAASPATASDERWKTARR